MSVYLTAPLQLDKICRACLTEKGDMRPLFGACLDEMLLSFAAIEVIMAVSGIALHILLLSIIYGNPLYRRRYTYKCRY